MSTALTVTGWLEKAREEKSKLLPADVNPERFWQVVSDQLRSNHEIQKCTPESVYKACLTAAQYGLEVGIRNMAHIVRYGDQAQLVVGYEGKIWLAVARSKTVRDVNTFQVRMNDFVERTEEGIKLRIKPFASEVERGPVVGYVAIANLTTGGRVEATMSETEYLKRRPRHWERTPHASHRDEMWEKGSVHKLMKLVPLTPDVAAVVGESDRVERAIELDAEVEIRPTESPTRGTAALRERLAQAPAPQPPQEATEEPEPVPTVPLDSLVDPGANQRPPVSMAASSQATTSEATTRLPLGRDLPIHKEDSVGCFELVGLPPWDRWTSGRQLAVAAAMKGSGIDSTGKFWGKLAQFGQRLSEDQYRQLSEMEDLLALFGSELRD